MERDILRKVQMIQLEIAKEVRRVCDNNNINYFLDSGTLLGAVGHKGFIPWDDDLDIGMLRSEYEKFLRVAPSELKEKYELIDWKSEKEYPHPMAKIIKKGTIYMEEARKDSGKQGIWVDILAYDNVPENPSLQKKQGRKITLYRGLIRAKCHLQTWTTHGGFNIYKWLRNLPFRILSIFYTKDKLVAQYEHTATLYNSSPAKSYFINGSSQYGKWFIPAECFHNFPEMEFEQELFKVPCGYDLYLKTAYGDYMKLPPESERENRHSIVKIDLGEQLPQASSTPGEQHS